MRATLCVGKTADGRAGGRPSEARPELSRYGATVALATLMTLFPATPVQTRTAEAATTNQSRSVYGSAVGGDSLFNSYVGGPDRDQIAYRFRATKSARLTGVVVYFQTGSGYSRGDHGVIRVAVRTDDGTSRHHPGSTILAKRDVYHPGGDAGKRIAFADPPSLVAGRIYHVVFSNVHASPAANFISLNGLGVFDDPRGPHPAFSATEWSGLIKSAGGSWSRIRRGSVAPIMGLEYSDGTTAGLGYMEVWVREPKTISGPRQARQIFRVSGRDRRVSTVSVRLKRLWGTAALRYELRRGGGKLIERGRIPARKVRKSRASMWSGSTWVSTKLKRTRTLKEGKSYRLVFRTTADTRYSIHVVRQGSSYRYGRGSFFSDGRAQYRTGGDTGWRSFTGWGRHSPEGDLQFYFR